MGKPYVRVGDKTDHGGVVLEGALTGKVDGKSIARVGDKVTCPRKGHGETTVIVNGDPDFLIDGKQVARHGDKTACGATLIASQIAAYDDAASAWTGSNGRGDSSATQTGSSPSAGRFDEQLQFVNAPGVARPGISYRVQVEDGRELIANPSDTGNLPRSLSSKQ